MSTTMLTVILLVILSFMILSFIYKTTFHHRKQYSDIPEVHNRWPLLGNLFDMTKTHLVLTDWSKTYGSIYRFSLYGEEVVVLNDSDVIYEALVTKGSDVAGRPYMKRTDYENRSKHSIVWQTYTPKLQFLRKKIHSSLRMYGSDTGSHQEYCNDELKQLVKRIDQFEGKPFDSSNLFCDSFCNIMFQLVLGNKHAHDDKELFRLKEINRLFNHTFGPGSSRKLDKMPFSWLFTSGEFQTLKRALRMRNSFWNDNMTRGDHEADDTSGSIISDLYSLTKHPQYSQYNICDNTLKEVFTNLILAGVDTTTTALNCFLLILLHYPDVHNKLYEEIDHVVSGLRLPKMADKSLMPYMEACLLETLRFISHVPLAVPHATICDTVIGGKNIPKNTTIYINLWAAHHDETHWSAPWTFNPDRFLDNEGRLVSPTHKHRRRLMVFGAGRRGCLGEAFAKNRLFLYATTLLNHFTFTRDTTRPLPDLDPRTFSLGIVLHPEDFNIVATKRNIDTVS